mgnify:CR=1 FL=1
MMTPNRPRMAVRAVLAAVGIVAALAAITHPWKALSQSAQPVIPLVNGTPGGTVSNPLNVAGSFSASFAGFPTTQTTGTPISVVSGGTGVTGTLPSGTVVVATNVGTTNIAYCKLGASATTSDQAITPNGGWFAFTVGASTQLTCITSTSTTTVNMVGGSGLPTGTGGGGGGSSSGITSWAGSTLGAISNYGTSPGAVTVPAVNAFVTNATALGQAVMASSSPVVIASNQSAIPVTLSSTVDPCQSNTKLYQPISQATSTQLFAGTSAKKTYVCHIIAVGADAENISLVAGTGSVWGTNTVAMIGGTTAATGPNLSANGGFSIGSGGFS